MALHKVELQLLLELESPLHVGTGYGLAGYLDSRILTDETGMPMVPGSSLKGRLRHTMQNLMPGFSTAEGTTDPTVNLFGEQDKAGALTFGDLRLSPEWVGLLKQAGGVTAPPGLRTEARTHVMLSRLRGVALEQRLFSLEMAPAHLTFEGRIDGTLPDCGRTVAVGQQHCPRDLGLLVAACCALTHLGGHKSRGLGRCRLVIPAAGLRVDDQVLDPDVLLEAFL